MSPLRVWIEAAPAEGVRQVVLSKEESSHLVRSLRARRGDALVLLDGHGLLAEAKLLSADPAGAAVEILRVRQVDPVRPAITVAQGMPKGGTMDDLVRTACEAGAAMIVPLETARCEVKLDAERAAAKRGRWTQQAAEACKQSGNPWQATIAPGEALANGASSQDSSPGNDPEIGEPTPSPAESAPSSDLGLELVGGIEATWGQTSAPSFFNNDIRL
jgi:RsmE family RNA methyltransferase